MNKSQLIDQIAEKAEISNKAAGAALDALMDSLGDALLNGESVVLPGFGTFAVRDNAARTGRNPQTGEALQIAASKTATFKQGKALKEKLN